ncbi:MAG: hypothetical protein N3F06_04410 [Nitrososphaerales archaeon]|nr:hypothetical protein [Nitrososphaerales archaeon]
MAEISRELLKKWRFRISASFIILSLIVLIDEVVKEGYVFDFFDLFNLAITHEKIFFILLISGLILGLRFKSPKSSKSPKFPKSSKSHFPRAVEQKARGGSKTPIHRITKGGEK